jgi:streptogramin lyase
MSAGREPGMDSHMRASRFNFVTAIALGAMAVLQAMPIAHAAAVAPRAAPGLIGVIRDSRGQPLAGAAVSVRSSAQTFTTSVYTDEQGGYVFPPLGAGTYRLWAQAVTFATGHAQLALDGRHTGHRDVDLQPLEHFESQLTGVEWYDALPDDSVDHRRLKQVLDVACTGCHGLDVVLQNRFDLAGWQVIIKAMEAAWYSGWRGAADLPASQLRWEGQIMRHHQDELAKYLAEMRGPGPSPMAFRPMDRPTGDAARIVVTEYDLPISVRENELPWYNGADWMDGPSTGMHGIVGTHDVTVDAAGNAWISHSGSRGTFETDRTLLKLEPQSGAMTAYKLLDRNGAMVPVEQISGLDAMCNIWMHSDDAFIKLDTRAGRFTSYPMPTVMGGSVNSTDVDSRGRVWANAHYGVVRLDPSGSQQAGVAYPGWKLFQQLTPGDGITYGITTDADDNVWWSESYVDKVATRNVATGVVREIAMHDPDYDARKALSTEADLAFYESIGAGTWSTNSASPLPYANMPRRLSADKQGNTVWVPNWAQSSLAEIDIHTLRVTYHPLPIHVHPYKTIVDRHHNVWTDTSLADAALKFSPATGEWVVYRLPSHGCGSRHMGFDDIRDEAWVACDQASRAARIQFRSPEGIRRLKAASTVNLK